MTLDQVADSGVLVYLGAGALAALLGVAVMIIRRRPRR
jgi:hypothetical protein